MSLTLEKLSKTWVIKMTPSKLHFIGTNSESAATGVQLWGQVNAVIRIYKFVSFLFYVIFIVVKILCIFFAF